MTIFRKTACALAFGLMAIPAVSADTHDDGGDAAGEITGDAAAGETVFRKCMACHEVGEGARNKVGPELNGVVGRQIAAIEDFNYSGALVEMGEAGETWTPEALSAFLEAPRGYAPGTKMAFPGLKDEADRDDVIAYLSSFEG